MPMLKVYIPPDLKQEMDKCPNVNWSRYAEATFRKLIQHVREKGNDVKCTRS